MEYLFQNTTRQDFLRSAGIDLLTRIDGDDPAAQEYRSQRISSRYLLQKNDPELALTNSGIS